MSSLRLTTQLQQKMVLTPQLRQRIEMLQMTSLELNELIEQEMVANPLLEEVMPGDEVQEISANILDQNADGHQDLENNIERGKNEDAENLSGFDDGNDQEHPERSPKIRTPQPMRRPNQPTMAEPRPLIL